MTQYEFDPETWAKPLEKSLENADAGKDETIVQALQGLTESLKDAPGGDKFSPNTI